MRNIAVIYHSDSSPDEVNKGDLETARLLGVRVAEFATKV